MKIRPLGSKFHLGGRADGHTDMTKLIVPFRNLHTRLKTLVHMDLCIVTLSVYSNVRHIICILIAFKSRDSTVGVVTVVGT